MCEGDAGGASAAAPAAEEEEDSGDEDVPRAVTEDVGEEEAAAIGLRRPALAGEDLLDKATEEAEAEAVAEAVALETGG